MRHYRTSGFGVTEDEICALVASYFMCDVSLVFLYDDPLIGGHRFRRYGEATSGARPGCFCYTKTNL